MNILCLVVDTLRADRLGCYGYFRNTSPVIDQIASEGVLFEDFYASAISTGAAFSCLISGLPAISSGFYITPVTQPNRQNFDDTIPTLPEIIQSNTDHTTLAVDNLINFAGHMKQMVRGFEFYINVARDGGFPQPEYTAGEANDRFLPWLRQHSDEPFFAFLHWWDPHHNPYRAPGYRDRFHQPPGSLEGLPISQAPAGYDYVPGWGKIGEIAWGLASGKLVRDVDGGAAQEAEQITIEEDGITQDLYDCSIAYLDNQLQRILDTLDEEGILDDTILILTADHGEGLGNHGTWGHGLLYEDTIHIPLIMWGPDILPQGRRIRGFAQHAHVAPTILDIMGVLPADRPVSSHLGSSMLNPERYSVEVDFAEESLLPRIYQETEHQKAIVTEVRRGPSDPGYRSFKTDDWKLIEGLDGTQQLYDLQQDPLEKINLAHQHPGRTETMSQQLHQWVQSHLGEDQEDPMRLVSALK